MMDIESLAVNAVTTIVGRIGRLKSFINVNDKTPALDGYINVYKDKKKSKENIKGKVSVQIKGTQNKEKARKFPVEIDDLNCWYEEGGIIFFVVYITKKGKTGAIFYFKFLPNIINKVLKKKKKDEQKSISIDMKELPEGDKEFEHIVFRFLENKESQSTLKKGEEYDLKVVQERLKEPPEIICNLSLVENDSFFYARDSVLNVTFPVEYIENIINLMVAYDDYRISANGNSYSYRAIVNHDVTHKGESIVYIEKSFKFIINEKTKKCSFKINIKGYLEDRIKAYKFLLDVIDGNGKMYFNGGEHPLKLPKKSLSKLNRNDYEKRLKNLELLKEVLYFFHVKEHLNLDKVTKEQHIYIDMLIYYFSHKEEGVKLNKEPPINGTITIGNIKIMLFFIKMYNGRYKIYDFFRYNKINIYVVDYKEKRYLTTRFSALKADEYLNISNIDFEIIEKEFKSYTNVGNYGVVNDSCLEMIKAYDKDNKRVDILDMAIILYDWLIERCDDDLIFVINKFQCYKRKRNFCNDEIKQLKKLLENKELSEASIVSIYTLLGDKESAKMHIEKFNEKEKESFSELPIGTLYKKL